MESRKMNEEKANFGCLPFELLFRILSQPVLTYKDCCRLAALNTRFATVCSFSNQELWKIKMMQTWPRLYHRLYALLSVERMSQIVWKEEIKFRHVYGSKIEQQLHLLSAKHYYDGEMCTASFQPFLDIQNKYTRQYGSDFQIDHIESILNDGRIHENLTVKYYAEKVIRFLKHQQLRNKWIQYLSQFEKQSNTNQSSCSMFPNGVETKNNHEESPKSSEQQSAPGDVIEGAILLSSWFQPNSYIDPIYIRQQIKLIAELTIDELKAVYPQNKLITKHGEVCLTDSEANSLNESLFPPLDCKQILMSLNNVLFLQLKFFGNSSRYYEPENSFIDKVIERRTGIPISLCILYQAIAAKLGVKVFLVNFPRHFLIKWLQFPDLKDNQMRYTYIDVFDGGRFLEQLPVYFNASSSQFSDWDSIVKPASVFRRMCNNLVEVGRQQENSNDGLLCLRNGLELSLIISPEDVESRMLLSRVYIHLNINLEEVEDMLNKISSRDPAATGIVMFLRQSVESQMFGKKKANNRPIRKTREKCDVKFAVGMIMKHKRYNYSCVIYGWDPKCAASRDWISQMGVHNLPNKDKQPFYNVLVEDGSTRYAAQENLIIGPSPQPINHYEVGKYFSTFCGRYYLPNEEKKSEYPDDEEFRKRLLSK